MQALQRTSAATYARNIRAAPRQVVANINLIGSSFIYALSAIPLTWEQHASSVIPSLPGFQDHFNIRSGSDASAISTYISIIYIGYAIGAALSFFINDRIGRRWAFRLYATIFVAGEMIVCFSPSLDTLIGARVVCGVGIGSLSVTGPMSIVEISPKEIRGLLTSWYTVAMTLSGFVASFCVYGIYQHVPVGRLQYQIPAFSGAIFMFLCIVASFFISESPRWLLLTSQRQRAIDTLVRLRRLPEEDPRVAGEIAEIEDSIISAMGDIEGRADCNYLAILKETFTVKSNLRRLQQVLVSYALAQVSGANSVTSYFIPVMSILGFTGDTSENIFLSGMYAFSKVWFCLISSFFFIDILGRRRSLFVGITVQMLTHIYLGVFIKFNQEGSVTKGASNGALAALFIHAFGYSVGLLILPYVFGGELWPNRIRSFGSALGQTFHWLFIYAIKRAFPSLLDATDNWGAFLFFAGCCFLGLIYVFFVVPEVAGLSVEQMNAVFEGPWYKAYRTKPYPVVLEVEDK